MRTGDKMTENPHEEEHYHLYMYGFMAIAFGV